MSTPDDIDFHFWVYGESYDYGIVDLSDLSSEAFITASRIYCERASVDEVVALVRGYLFEEYEEKYEEQLGHKVALSEFRRMIDKLQAAGNWEEAFKRIQETPEAAGFVLRQPDQNVAQLQTEVHEWKCKGCGTSFSYNKLPKDNKLGLSKCPCCSSTTKSGTTRKRKELPNEATDKDGGKSKRSKVVTPAIKKSEQTTKAATEARDILSPANKKGSSCAVCNKSPKKNLWLLSCHHVYCWTCLSKLERCSPGNMHPTCKVCEKVSDSYHRVDSRNTLEECIAQAALWGGTSHPYSL